jgi:hypothetical protein
MSVDDRLRNALRDQADSFVPPVETALDRVRARGERWRNATVTLAASAAAAIAIGGVWAVSELNGQDALQPARTPTAPASPTSAAEGDASPLRGTITADVAQPPALTGTWTLTLNGNGTMDVEPPADHQGDVSGALFTADTTSFRTRLFEGDRCRGDGTGFYTWLRVGRRIEFQAVSDTCADRTTFFENATWAVSTGLAARD